MEMPAELMEMSEQILEAEELTQQIEMYENELEEAMKEGSKDMAEYYKEKLEQLKGVKVGQESEIHFGGYHAGLTANQWREKAAEEYVANGNSRDYKKYKDFALRAENN